MTRRDFTKLLAAGVGATLTGTAFATTSPIDLKIDPNYHKIQSPTWEGKVDAQVHEYVPNADKNKQYVANPKSMLVKYYLPTEADKIAAETDGKEAVSYLEVYALDSVGNPTKTIEDRFYITPTDRGTSATGNVLKGMEQKLKTQEEKILDSLFKGKNLQTGFNELFDLYDTVTEELKSYTANAGEVINRVESVTDYKNGLPNAALAIDYPQSDTDKATLWRKDSARGNYWHKELTLNPSQQSDSTQVYQAELQRGINEWVIRYHDIMRATLKTMSESMRTEGKFRIGPGD